MLKFIISLYVCLILLVAGFAKAEALDFKSKNMLARVSNAKQIELGVSDISIQPNSDVVILSGPTPTPCVESVKPVLSMDSTFKTLSIRVISQDVLCTNPLTVMGEYQIAIDLKAFFAEYSVKNPTTIQVEIKNATDGSKYFEYDVLPQGFFQFDTHVKGIIEKDESTQTFFLKTKDNRIEVLSRFDLNPFQNKFVNIKGLIPGQVSIGLGYHEVPKQLIAGQLISLL